MKLHQLPAIAAVILAALFSSASAQISWTGATNGNWNEISNWNPNQFPNTTETVTFPSVASSKAMNNNRPIGTDFADLFFSGSGYTLTGVRLDLNSSGTPQIRYAGGLGTNEINLPVRLMKASTISRSVTGGVVIGGNYTLRLGTSADIQLNGNQLTLSAVDSLIDVDGVISGATGSVLVSGSGSVRFDGNQTFAGSVTVQSTGTLSVNGTMAGSVIVNSGGRALVNGAVNASGSVINGTLGGGGTLAGTVTVGGTVDPGTASGGRDRLTFSTLTFSSGVTTDEAFFDLLNTTPATGHDQIRVTNAVTPNGAKINLRPVSGFRPGQSFVLIDKTSLGAMTTGFRTSTGAALNEETTEVIQLNRWQYSYEGGTGNDFTATTIPSTSSGSRAWDGGGGSANWSNAANWDNDVFPVASNTVVFGALAPVDKRTVTVISGNPFQLSFLESGYTLNGASEIYPSNGVSAQHASGTNTLNNPFFIPANQTWTTTGGGNLTFTGATDLGSSTLTLSAVSTGTLSHNGALSGGGNLIKDGAGLVELGGAAANTFSGTTIVNRGELRLTKSSGNAVPGNVSIGGGANPASLTTTVTDKIANTAVVTLNANGTFAIGGTETIGELIVNGGTINQGSNTLAVDTNVTVNENLTVGPGSLQINATLAQSRDITVAANKTFTTSGLLAIPSLQAGSTLIKKGTGTLFVASDTSPVVLRVDAGTVQVNTSHPSNRPSISLNGGVLNGIGRTRLVSSIAGGGTFSPGLGTSSHLWSATGLSFASNATTLELDLNGTTAGTGFDQIVIVESGTVSLGSAKLIIRDNQIFSTGTIFRIIDNDLSDAVSGTFNGLPNGATVRGQFNQYTISYTGGTGNDVTLTVVNPTPSGTLRVWTGLGANTNWDNPANWDGGVTVPGYGDALRFPANAFTSTTSPNNNFPAGMTFASVTIDTNISTNQTRTITGAAIQLLGGISCSVSDDGLRAIEIDLPITLLSTSAVIANTGTPNPRSLIFKRPLTTSGGTLTFDGGGGGFGSIQFSVFPTSATISGGAHLVVTGNASVKLDASNSHTFTGPMTVNHGALESIRHSLLSNGLTVGDGANPASAVVASSTGPVTGNVLVRNNGTLEGGPFDISTLTVDAGGTVNANAGTGTLAVTGTLSNAGSVSCSILAAGILNQTSGSLSVSNQLSAGMLTLASGSFTGPACNIQVDNAFGVQIPVTCASVSAGSLDTSVDALAVTGALQVTGAAITSGTLHCASLSAATLTIDNTVITVLGNASIGGDLTIDNSDSFTCGSLTAANLSVPNHFSSVLAVGGDIVLSGNASILKTLSFAGRLTFTTVGGPNHSITVGTSSLTLGGLGGADAGSQVSITKFGSGTVQVNTHLTHISEIEIKAGTFRTNAPDGDGVGHVFIDGGTLAGSGTLGPVTLGTTPNSKIAPGGVFGGGRLTVSDYAETTAGTPPELKMTIFGTVAGESYDQIQANGIFVLDPAVQTRLNLTLTGIFFTTFIPLEGTEYVLIDKTSPGPVSGQFYDGAIAITEGYEKNFAGNPGQTVRFRFSYAGGDGNDFTATVISSPFGPSREWTGLSTTDSNWSTATNWEGNQLPSAGEWLKFPDGAARTTNVNNIPAGLLLNRIDIEAPYTITGNALSLAGDLNFSVAAGLATFSPPVTFENDGGSGERLITLIGDGSARVDGQLSLSDGLLLVLNRVGLPTLPALEVGAINTVSGASGTGLENRGGGRVRLLPATRVYDLPTNVIDGTFEVIGRDGPVNPVLPDTEVIIGGGPNPAALECINGLAPVVQDCISNNSTVRLLPNGVMGFLDGPGGAQSGDVINILSFEGGTITDTGRINIIDEVRVLTNSIVETDLIFRSVSDLGQEDLITVNPGVTFTVKSRIDYADADTPAPLRVAGGGTLDVEGIFENTVVHIEGTTVRIRNNGQLQVANIYLEAGAFLGPFGSGIIRGRTTVTANIHPVAGTVIGGSGKIFGNITASGAVISPGSLTGGTSRLIFEGPFEPPAGTIFRYDIGGSDPISDYDLILTEFGDGTVFSPVNLSGTLLDVNLINGFVPTPGEKFTLLLDIINGFNDPGLFADGSGGSLEEGEQIVIDGYVFSISYTGDNLSGPTADDIELTAVGPLVEIAVEQPEGTEIPDGGSVDFGPVVIGATADLDFTIRNSGIMTLNLTGNPDLVSVSGEGFTVESQPSSAEVIGGGTTAFMVRFAPTSVGLKSGQLIIENNDPDEGSYVINLIGTGIGLAPPAPPSLASVVFTPATATEPAKFSATITGPPNAAAVLEASRKLGELPDHPWTVIHSFNLDANGVAVLTDIPHPGSAGFETDFFRVRLP